MSRFWKLLDSLEKYTNFKPSDYSVDDWEPTDKTSDAQIVASRIKETGKHHLLIDLDVPAHLIPSTTEGHSHLYIECGEGIEWGKIESVLSALVSAGIVEGGYASASIERGFTALRTPWTKKKKTDLEHVGNGEIEDANLPGMWVKADFLGGKE